MPAAQASGCEGSVPDDVLNPPQKVLRRRLGPAGRAAAQRKREQQELRELRAAKEAAEAARAQAEAEKLRLDARLQEQEEAAWAAKLAQQRAMERAQELEADLWDRAESATKIRSRVMELDAQLAAARAASEAAARRHKAALRSQLEKVEKELRDNALHTGRPSTQARWAIGVVQSLAPMDQEPDPQLSQHPQAPRALVHQPVALNTPPAKSAAELALEQRDEKGERGQPAPNPKHNLRNVPSKEQQMMVRDKYSSAGGEEKAAAFLQSVVRGAKVRRKAKEREHCARMLQAATRGWKARRETTRKRVNVNARIKAEQDLLQRMQELAQRSGLRADWRKSRNCARQLKSEPEPELEPEPKLEPEPEPEAVLHSRQRAGGRRRRSSRPSMPDPPLATTFAGLQPRWRQTMARPQSVPAMYSLQQRPETADTSEALTRTEVFPDVRFPGGQPGRPRTALPEMARAERDRQRLRDTAAAFGFAGATHARRRERQQRRNVRKWDGSALPHKGAPVSTLGASPFSPEYAHDTESQQAAQWFTDDEFSDPSAILDEKIAAASEAAMSALSRARADYEKASVGLPPRNPHTYVVEYPNGSIDMFGGGGVAVGPEEATAVKTVDEIQRELDSLLQASSQRENAESQDGNVSGSPERKGQHKLRMWSKDQNGGWNESLGNLDRAGDRLRTASLGSVGTSDSAVGHQYTSSASAGSAKRRGRKSQSTVFHQYTSALKVADEQHPPAPSEISRAQPTDAIQVIMV